MRTAHAAAGRGARVHASRQAGFLVLFGAIFVAAALGVSAVQLVRLRSDKRELENVVWALQQRKEALSTQNAALDQTLATRRREIEDLEQQRALLLQSVKELSPAPAATAGATPTAARPNQLHGQAQTGPGLVTPSMARASASQTAESMTSDRNVYDFAVWLDLPHSVRERVRQVSYTFDHPTFQQKRLTSTDPASGFRAGYRGWGCLSTVLVQVDYRDGPSDRFLLDQCAAVVASGDRAEP
jgi:hypothetical protein